MLVATEWWWGLLHFNETCVHRFSVFHRYQHRSRHRLQQSIVVRRANSTCQGNFSFAVWIRVSNLISGSTDTILDKRSFNQILMDTVFGQYKDGQGKSYTILLADGQGSLGDTNNISDSLLSERTVWNQTVMRINHRPMRCITFNRIGRSGIRLPTDW